MKHLFCFGLGYTAQRLIKYLNNIENDIWKFSGTSRSSLKLLDTKVYNFDELAILPSDITHILISIPPNLKGDLIYERFLNQIKLLKKLSWIGYFSSTGVYGNHFGKWVNEESELNLYDIHAKNRHLAETQWLSYLDLYNLPLNIYRLSGIYGPLRSAFENALNNKLTIIDKPEAVFSRIHVDDIVRILHFSIKALNKGSVYNLADDYPCNPREVSEMACKILGIPIPKAVKLEESNLSEFGLSFYKSFKRVSNEKVKKELRVQLLYPNYKSGLQAIAQECGYKIVNN